MRTHECDSCKVSYTEADSDDDLERGACFSAGGKEESN
jgi:hypothetical protein